MKTGSHFKVKSMGTNVMGVELEDNPQKPEPIYFRVVLPFGDVDIVRCDDNSYWVHVRVDKPNDSYAPHDKTGRFVDGRIDIIGKHASDCDQGDYGHPDMQHMAVRIAQVTP